MLLAAFIYSLVLAATAQEVEDDWIDPYDMLNYDPTTKTMRESVKVQYDDGWLNELHVRRRLCCDTK